MHLSLLDRLYIAVITVITRGNDNRSADYPVQVIVIPIVIGLDSVN